MHKQTPAGLSPDHHVQRPSHQIMPGPSRLTTWTTNQPHLKTGAVELCWDQLSPHRFSWTVTSFVQQAASSRSQLVPVFGWRAAGPRRSWLVPALHSWSLFLLVPLVPVFGWSSAGPRFWLESRRSQQVLAGPSDTQLGPVFGCFFVYGAADPSNNPLVPVFGWRAAGPSKVSLVPVSATAALIRWSLDRHEVISACIIHLHKLS